MAFIRYAPVRFDDVDFARIVYFPRFFGYCHETFEEFFASEAGEPYVQVLTQRNLGFPTVHAEADFRHPLRFGDRCRVEMKTERVGRSSITSLYSLFLNDSDTLCASVKLVTAAVQMDTMKSAPLPEDLRRAFEKHR